MHIFSFLLQKEKQIGPLLGCHHNNLPFTKIYTCNLKEASLVILFKSWIDIYQAHMMCYMFLLYPVFLELLLEDVTCFS